MESVCETNRGGGGLFILFGRRTQTVHVPFPLHGPFVLAAIVLPTLWFSRPCIVCLCVCACVCVCVFIMEKGRKNAKIEKKWKEKGTEKKEEKLNK